jgi:hypothetical protein
MSVVIPPDIIALSFYINKSSMLQLKKLLWLVLLVLSLQSSWAFSLLGPVGNGDDSYQQTVIGYNPLANGNAPPFIVDGQPSGPKNLGEEYRRNVPVLYYAADSTFLDYFGSNGLAAVDQTYTILNNVLTNSVDTYSKGLTEFPLNTTEPNYEAQALELTDLKSEALYLMTEQLGLADAVRYTWALHDRFQPGGTTCPNDTEYAVIMRNFDISSTPLNQIQYSPYVNGVLYDYFIFENCGAAGASPPDADAVEFPDDPLENNPPVASEEDPILPGYFYTGLTRDDVAGLRYLLSSNNINTENVQATSQLIVTNTSSPTILTTFSLAQLFANAQTNPPSVLTALFPGLQITSVTTNFSLVNVPNVFTYLQNMVGAPVGTVQLITQTNGFTASVVINYTYTFGNLMNSAGQSINNFSINSPTTITVQTIQITNLIGAPYDSAIDILTTSKIIKTNGVSGDFFLLPANVCSFNIITNLGSQVVYTTNATFTATSVTNLLGSSVFFQQVLSSYTNHFLLVQQATCSTTTAGPALRQGIQKIKFIRANFDSLLGQFFQPVTNNYSMVTITNYQIVTQSFQRVVTQPDFVFSAADLASGPSAAPLVAEANRSITFDTSAIIGGLAGPGIITSPASFTFDKVGPVFLNIGPASLTGGLISFFNWGSFDETTNPPVVYPNGTSIDNLISQVLIQISPGTLPDATNGVPYDVVLSASNGQPPFTWSIVSGSLPNGLTLSSSGEISGKPTGNTSGIYNFTIELTDTNGRATDFNYSITVN